MTAQYLCTSAGCRRASFLQKIVVGCRHSHAVKRPLPNMGELSGSSLLFSTPLGLVPQYRLSACMPSVRCPLAGSGVCESSAAFCPPALMRAHATPMSAAVVLIRPLIAPQAQLRWGGCTLSPYRDASISRGRIHVSHSCTGPSNPRTRDETKPPGMTHPPTHHPIPSDLLPRP
ncbi:hypothetical protein BV20DRAFT_448462 [Pilatotrama ljubarskyi]|nr:hypothetical protein BV20DRAFT_448462 [Pilatotrama ljubarskyi]